VQIGRDEQLDLIVGDIMLANSQMLNVSKSAGFRRRPGVVIGIVSVELALGS
jgi:hypothetical protein